MMVTVKVLTMSKISLVLYSAAQIYPNQNICICIYAQYTYTCMHIQYAHAHMLHYLGVSQREPKVKIAPHFCFCPSQIAIWALKRLHAFASLLVVSAHAQVCTSAHGKKWWIYLMTAMISFTLKPHTNAHTVFGRPH